MDFDNLIRRLFAKNLQMDFGVEQQGNLDTEGLLKHYYEQETEWTKLRDNCYHWLTRNESHKDPDMEMYEGWAKVMILIISFRRKVILQGYFSSDFNFYGLKTARIPSVSEVKSYSDIPKPMTASDWYDEVLRELCPSWKKFKEKQILEVD